MSLESSFAEGVALGAQAVLAQAGVSGTFYERGDTASEGESAMVTVRPHGKSVQQGGQILSELNEVELLMNQISGVSVINDLTAVTAGGVTYVVRQVLDDRAGLWRLRAAVKVVKAQVKSGRYS